MVEVEKDSETEDASENRKRALEEIGNEHALNKREDLGNEGRGLCNGDNSTSDDTIEPNKRGPG